MKGRSAIGSLARVMKGRNVFMEVRDTLGIYSIYPLADFDVWIRDVGLE